MTLWSFLPSPVLLRISYGAVLILSACATPKPTPHPAPTDACALVDAVLRSVIAPGYDDLHLQKACVDQYATANGITWVDARVFDQNGSPIVPKGCQIPKYQIRFGAPTDPSVPLETILLISITARPKVPIHFSSQIENTDWQSRRPNTYGNSPCWTANGTITIRPRGFDVHITPSSIPDLE